MAQTTLYLRSTQSTVVTSTTTVKQLTTAQGTALNTGTSVKNAKTTGTFIFTPGTASSTTTLTPGSTPNNKGWIFDAQTATTYAAGNWTVTVESTNSSASGTATMNVSAWVVTATTTAVTSVTQIASNVTSTSFTPSTTAGTNYTVTFNPGQVTVGSGQYLYFEIYFQVTAGGSSTTGTQTIDLDDTTGTATKIVTPGVALSQSLNANLYMYGSQTYQGVVLADSPIAYYRCNDTGTTLTDSGPNALNGTIGASCTTGGTALISGDSAAASLTTPGGAESNATIALVPRSTLFEVTAAVSLEAWITIPAFPAASFVDFVAYTPNTHPAVENYAIELDNATNKFFFTVYNTGSSFGTGSPAFTFSTNTTYHVVGTYDQTNVKLYVNGSLVGSTACTGAIKGYGTNCAFAIGGDAVLTNGINATFEEVAAYGYALTASQVSTHYNIGRAPVNGFSKAIGKILQAALNFVGSLTSSKSGSSNHYTQALSASLTFSGSQVKSMSRSIGASLISSGSIIKNTSRSLSAAIVSTASIAKSVTRTLAGAWNSSGSFTKSVSKIQSAQIAATGSVQKSVQKLTAATLNLAGTAKRGITRSLSAALGFAATQSKRTGKAFAATLGFLGNLTTSSSHVFFVNLNASLTFSGSVARNTTYKLAALLAPVGTISKASTYALTSSLTVVANLSKSVAKGLVATLAPVGALAKSTSRVIVSALNFVAAITSNTASSIVATMVMPAVKFTAHLFKQVILQQNVFQKITMTKSAIGRASVDQAIVIPVNLTESSQTKVIL